MQHPQISRLAMQALLVMIPMILSLTVHEYAHALVARALGDATAERAGRLTLNPLVHLDPLGSLMLPFGILLLSGMAGGGAMLPIFGYARPTPVNAGNFRRSVTVRRGSLWVAAAGPAANFVLALLCALLLGTARRALPELAEPWVQFLQQMVLIGVGLGVFNLLPLRPLDGHALVSAALAPAAAQRFEAFTAKYALLCMFGVMFFAGNLLLRPITLIAAGMLAVAGM